MLEITKKLLKDLQWVASHKDNSLTLECKDARKILESLGEDWCPEVEKETNRDLALRSLKRGLEEKYGRKNVGIDRFLEHNEKDGRDYEHVVVSVSGPWPDEAVALLAKASGFSRHFEESGSGAGMGYRDIVFVAKRGKRVSA